MATFFKFALIGNLLVGASLLLIGLYFPMIQALSTAAIFWPESDED